jgi:glycosyltransferase involved in cell wall biosynthesis
MVGTQEITQPKERQATLPTFSIVYETENLTSVELDNIYRSLSSIAAQEVSPDQANEFLIIDGGYAPEQVIQELCSMYPWVTVRRIPQISYYSAKMAGAQLVSGEVVIFLDSDCVYTPNWLKDVLTVFANNPAVNIVAGETSTKVSNSYELAIAMHYFFPRFSNREEPYVSREYFMNAVAFRRDFLIENPIPTDVSLYRGNCNLHCVYLRTKAQQILKHPQAQALHEPPTLSFLTWRYLLRGRDRVLKQYFEAQIVEHPDQPQLGTPSFTFPQKVQGIFSTLLRFRPFRIAKIRTSLKEDPKRIFSFPLAIPFFLWFESLYTIGGIATYFQPNLIRDIYYKVSSDGDSESAAEVMSTQD